MTVDIFLSATAGVLVSVLLPPLSIYVRALFPQRQTPAAGLAAVPSWIAALKPYALLGLFSLITALMVLAALGDKVATWREAIIAGYAWDSTLQKLAKT